MFLNLIIVFVWDLNTIYLEMVLADQTNYFCLQVDTIAYFAIMLCSEGYYMYIL